MREVKFSYTRPGGDRLYHVTEEDIRIVLSRMPDEATNRLRRVHFNDRTQLNALGYVTRGHREIALCALPPRLSFTRSLSKGESCAEFGAVRGTQWPELAVRRFILYGVFLHELGHLQVIKNNKTQKLSFAMEKLADEFAHYCRRRLWMEQFDHPDPVHNAPTEFNMNTRQVLQTIQNSIYKM
ncbi:MAG: hypothetical protein AB7P14_15170 [Blastocatellales bacterium]